MRVGLRIPYVLSILVCVITMLVHRGLAQSNAVPFEWQQQTNYGLPSLIISNLVVTNISGSVTALPPLLITNLVVTNFLPVTNFGPWGPAGPPPAPAPRPWYKKIWDWLKRLF